MTSRQVGLPLPEGGFLFASLEKCTCSGLNVNLERDYELPLDYISINEFSTKRCLNLPSGKLKIYFVIDGVPCFKIFLYSIFFSVFSAALQVFDTDLSVNKTVLDIVIYRSVLVVL